jgi:1,3-beta-glucanosyltransferase GAS1
LNVAAYFSEYGCVASPGTARTWQEVGSLFSSDMSDVFSGGIAFNYFPAQSADGQFGMVTISDDGKSVQTSDDYTNLQSAYKNVSAPSDPSKSSAPQASYPECPGQNNTFLASNNLPPTPSVNACSCLAKAAPCTFHETTRNRTQTEATVGTLLDYTCSLLGQHGLSCDDISASGSDGHYGNASACDPGACL